MNQEKKQLLPNPDIYLGDTSLPKEIKESIESLDSSKLGATTEEQEDAKEMLENWSATLWKAMVFIANTPGVKSNPNHSSELIEGFKNKFAEKLNEFVVHKDHGITHALHVYKGMVRLADLDKEKANGQNDHEEYDDKFAQLLALTHDSMQMLPFDIIDKPEISQRSKHAALIALIVRSFAKDLGIDKKEAKELAFGLRKHDSTYDGAFYPNGKFKYLAKLLHDADKLFGTGLGTEIESLAAGMLERNLIGNKGTKGSFLIQTELDKEHREKFKYGDRCVNDAIAVVLKELSLPMYTDSGQEIAEERIKHILEQIDLVYGNAFDETKKTIDQNIIPNLEGGEDGISFSVGGLGNKIRQIDELPEFSSPISSKDDLKELIEKLYSTPLPLLQKNKRIGYDNDSAKGWKLFVKKENQEYSLDPSIARFCFSENGKQIFLSEIKEAFKNQLNLATHF